MLDGICRIALKIEVILHEVKDLIHNYQHRIGHLERWTSVDIILFIEKLNFFTYFDDEFRDLSSQC